MLSLLTLVNMQCDHINKQRRTNITKQLVIAVKVCCLLFMLTKALTNLNKED